MLRESPVIAVRSFVNAFSFIGKSAPGKHKYCCYHNLARPLMQQGYRQVEFNKVLRPCFHISLKEKNLFLRPSQKHNSTFPYSYFSTEEAKCKKCYFSINRQQYGFPAAPTFSNRVPLAFYHYENLRVDLANFMTDWKAEFMQKSSGTRTRALILLLLCSSGLYAVWSHGLFIIKADDDVKEMGQEIFSTYANLLGSAFTVNAAKPLQDEKISSSSDETFHKGNMGSRRQNFNFIADVLEAVQDAVVCIEVKDHSTTNWFGIPQGSSNGSGFIVKEDGLILTNAHVVASHQRNSITVKLHDGRCFAGYIEDVDYESDLATVRVKARGLPTLTLGCSSETRIGEWVVAVGSPLNLSNSVTAGVVSSTRRGANELGIHANDINYIQTDAAITFGNSGGPLINLDGEAIGINSMKVTPGISFAIPIDHAKKFLQRAEIRRASGKSKASRRYMGLTILTLTEQIRKELESRTGLNVVNEGVLVWQVVRGGPAYLSGVQPGDIITSINGKSMRSAAEVHEVVKTDDELVMEVYRGGRKLIVRVAPENVIQ